MQIESLISELKEYVKKSDYSENKEILDSYQTKYLNGYGGSDFYLDEGLMKKLESKWEEPTEDEYDVIYKVER